MVSSRLSSSSGIYLPVLYLLSSMYKQLGETQNHVLLEVNAEFFEFCVC